MELIQAMRQTTRGELPLLLGSQIIVGNKMVINSFHAENQLQTMHAMLCKQQNIENQMQLSLVQSTIDHFFWY